MNDNTAESVALEDDFNDSEFWAEEQICEPDRGLKKEDKSARPTPRWLYFDADVPYIVPDWIFLGLKPGTVGLLTATGGTGKSFFAQDLALSVSAGYDYCGLGINKPGPVMYLSFEEDEEDLLNRGNAIFRQGLDGNIPDPEMFHVASMFGEELNLVKADGTLNTDDFEWLKAQSVGMRLVVLDPLYCLHSADENNGSHMKTLMTALKRICRETGCGMLICQHTNKSSTLNKLGDTAEAAKGSITISNSARLHLTLSPFDDKGVLKLCYSKLNGCARPEDIILVRGPEGVLQEKEGASWGKNAVYKRPNGALKKKELKAVSTAKTEEVPVDTVPSELNEKNDLANNRFAVTPYLRMNVDDIFFHSEVL